MTQTSAPHPSPPVGGEAIAIFCTDANRPSVLSQILTQRGYSPCLVDGTRSLQALLDHGLCTAVVIAPSVSLARMKRLCLALRPRYPLVPIVVVLRASDQSQAISLLEQGADHYLTFPFETRALQIAMAALTRRNRQTGLQATPTNQ